MNTTIKLLVHNDHLLIEAGLNAVLMDEGDIEVVAQTAHHAEVLKQVVQLRPHVLLITVLTQDTSVENLIQQAKSYAPETAILVISMCRDEGYAASCLRAGVSGFINICRSPVEVISAVRQVAKGVTCIRTNYSIEGPAPDSGHGSDGTPVEQPGYPESNVVVGFAGSRGGRPQSNLVPWPGTQGFQDLESQRILAPLSCAMDELAQELGYLATHDALTGLVNRGEFERRLKGAVKDGKITGTEHSLLYLDLDQFKLINDTCGHVAGDGLLRHISELLKKHTRASDTLARLGGDEFALLLYGCPAEPAGRIAELLRQLIERMQFNWKQRRFGGSVSIGVVTFTGGTLDFEQVLSTADSACFVAKEKGRNRVHIYHPDDAELSVRLQEMNWVCRLREALENQRLMLYAQEIVPVAEGLDDRKRLEILVRLKETDGTIVPPSAFIPAAERYNLMPAVDRYVVSAAFHYVAGLAEDDTGSYSINLSGATLNDEDFPAFVEQQLIEHGLMAGQICFEITETSAIANLTRTAEVIRTLKLSGFQFALDDFGKGMSSLAYLKHLPVDFIKIDGEFIRNLVEDEVDGAMVRAISNIAHTMGIKTVAEFVENDAVFDLLKKLGVDFVQGYGIHKPEPLMGQVRDYPLSLVVSEEMQ